MGQRLTALQRSIHLVAMCLENWDTVLLFACALYFLSSAGWLADSAVEKFFNWKKAELMDSQVVNRIWDVQIGVQFAKMDAKKALGGETCLYGIK